MDFRYLVLGFKFYFLTVERLATSGAKMVVISNSSRRASITMEKLKTLGFDPSLFLGAITSGELTHQYLQRLTDHHIIINLYCFAIIKHHHLF